MNDIDLDGLPSTDDQPVPESTATDACTIPDMDPEPTPTIPPICYGAFVANEASMDRSVEANVATYNAITAAHMSIRELALNKVAAALSLINPVAAASDADTTSMLSTLANTAMSIAGQNERSALQVAAANKRLLEKSDSAKIAEAVTTALVMLNRGGVATNGSVDTNMDSLLEQVASTVDVPEGMLVKSNEEGLPEEYK